MLEDALNEVWIGNVGDHPYTPAALRHSVMSIANTRWRRWAQVNGAVGVASLFADLLNAV